MHMHVVRDRKYPEMAYVVRGRSTQEVHMDSSREKCSNRKILMMAYENERE